MGPGGITGKHIDLTRLQCSKTLFRGQWLVGHLTGITQHRCSNGTADIDIKTRPATLLILLGETRQTSTNTTAQLAFALHIFKGSRLYTACD